MSVPLGIKFEAASYTSKGFFMNRRTLIPVLLIVAIIAIGYAIYRSTAVRQTIMQNNLPTVYGEPQHGLLLGLCVVAGFCILGAVLLVDKEWTTRSTDVIRRDERTDLPRRTLS